LKFNVETYFGDRIGKKKNTNADKNRNIANLNAVLEQRNVKDYGCKEAYIGNNS
jgi:hypothetical protein